MGTKWNTGTMTIQSALASFTAALQSKHFADRADMLVVRCIFHAFLLKRLLLDAVLEQRPKDVEDILDQLEEADLRKATLDQPVDSNLNTLLHVAVHIGSVTIVEMLLSHGASRQMRNFRGDLPVQWFGLPRIWSRAAFACMTFQRKTSRVRAVSSSGFARKAMRLQTTA